MMDSRPILPGSFHPQAPWTTLDKKGSLRPRSRTRYPVNYYITDFGVSQIYDANDPNPLAVPILGGDKTVPEFQKDTQTPRNPFHTDVYYMGNLVRTCFLDVCNCYNLPQLHANGKSASTDIQEFGIYGCLDRAYGPTGA